MLSFDISFGLRQLYPESPHVEEIGSAYVNMTWFLHKTFIADSLSFLH